MRSGPHDLNKKWLDSHDQQHLELQQQQQRLTHHYTSQEGDDIAAMLDEANMQLDASHAEVDRCHHTIAAWKLRYYVEHLRLEGTRNAATELRDELMTLRSHLHMLTENGNHVKGVEEAQQIAREEALSRQVARLGEEVESLSADNKELPPGTSESS